MNGVSMADTEAQPEAAQSTGMSDTSRNGISWRMAITGVVMGLIIGGLAGWATLNLGVGAIVFVVVWAASAYYLYRKPIPSAAIGSGLYISALVALLLPILFYVPTILSSSEGESAEAVGAFAGGILGLFIWGFVFLVVAVVLAAIGYFVNRRAKKKLAA